MQLFLRMSAIRSLRCEPLILPFPTPNFFLVSATENIDFATYLSWDLTSHSGHCIWHRLQSYDLPFLDNDSGYLASDGTSNSLGNVPSTFIMSSKILIPHFSQESCSHFSSLSKTWTPKLNRLASNNNWNQIPPSRLYDPDRRQMSWEEAVSFPV